MKGCFVVLETCYCISLAIGEYSGEVSSENDNGDDSDRNSLVDEIVLVCNQNSFCGDLAYNVIAELYHLFQSTAKAIA